MSKNCPFGEGIALVLCVAKSCTRTTRALVYEVFKMAAQYKRTQHCRPEKEFFKALEYVTRVKKGFGPGGCGFLCCALTGQQPDTKNKQAYVKLS